MKVSFILRNPKAKKSAIYLTVRWNRRQVKWSTGLSIDPDDWNQNTRQPKGRVPNRLAIVQTLNQFEQLVYDVKLAYEKDNGLGSVMPLDEFKERFGVAIGRREDPTEKDRSFILWAKEYCIGKRAELMQAVQTVETYLDGKDLEFDQVKAKFVDGLIAFMKRQGLKISTINHKLGSINYLMSVAAEYELHSNPYKIKRRKLSSNLKKPVIALTVEELTRLASLDVTGNLEMARDLFLISFYSGQRHSDASRICPEMIKDGELHLTQKKTAAEVEIPLRLLDGIDLPYTFTELLEKYNYKAPDLYYQTYLKLLTELAQMARINEPVKNVVDENGKRKHVGTVEKWTLVTSHTSRKSFCTYLFQRGMELESIAAFSGHKSLDTLTVYIGEKRQKEKARALRDAQKCLGFESGFSSLKKAI